MNSLEVLFPIRLHPGAFTCVALRKEPLQILPRLEALGAMPLLQPFMSRRPQPRAKAQALPARLLDKAGFVLIRNDQLHPGH